MERRELENLRDHYVHLKKKRRSTSGSGASISLKPEDQKLVQRMNLLSEHIIERNHKTKGNTVQDENISVDIYSECAGGAHNITMLK